MVNKIFYTCMIQSVYQTKIQSLDKTTPKHTRILQLFDADVALPRSLKVERTSSTVIHSDSYHQCLKILYKTTMFRSFCNAWWLTKIHAFFTWPTEGMKCWLTSIFYWRMSPPMYKYVHNLRNDACHAEIACQEIKWNQKILIWTFEPL